MEDRRLIDICNLTKCFRVWQSFFANDSDKLFLFDGICNGFRLINSPLDCVAPADSHNYQSALSRDAKPYLDKLFSEELRSQKITRTNMIFSGHLHSSHSSLYSDQQTSFLRRKIRVTSKNLMYVLQKLRRHLVFKH